MSAIPLLLILSFISFMIIQLPPGDYADQIKANAIIYMGVSESDAQIMAESYRVRYGLNEPIFYQYFLWIKAIVTEGNFGFSFSHNKPISELVGQRLPITLLIALICHIGATLIGASLGVLAAAKHNTWVDRVTTVFAFIGLTTPRFVLSLIILYILLFKVGATNVASLFSAEFAVQPWSFAKVADLFLHVWPVILIAVFGGLAQNLRVMRANMLDVLHAQYIETAVAKGLSRRKVLFKHAVPNALHPLLMFQGVALPYMVMGELEIAIVFALPTVGPLIVSSMQTQDTLVVATFMMLLATMLIVGNIIADILLAMLDPRVRLG